jgi:hypothetical protein
VFFFGGGVGAIPTQHFWHQPSPTYISILLIGLVSTKQPIQFVAIHFFPLSVILGVERDREQKATQGSRPFPPVDMLTTSAPRQ